MSLQIAKHCFTVREYHRMGEAGVFHPEARLELIEGEIIEMSPVGERHAACVKRLSRTLNRQVDDTVIVSTQDPILLDDGSEPQPDIALLKFRDDFYRNGHPRPEDVLLVIEVSDTTLQYDRRVKLPLYARAGISEALIFNLPDEQLEYHAQPTSGANRISGVFKRGEALQSSNVPGVTFDVDFILG
ncbi:MAG: Uma2 family endonuclease [Pyrinomonadaceae bacterium MAG19_C2-C3]|nr:Uma2 family endonuclease [Pyrinomonadaceae bacterium MAG19_C2-C3]